MMMLMTTIIIILFFNDIILQCKDAVSWAMGRYPVTKTTDHNNA